MLILAQSQLSLLLDFQEASAALCLLACGCGLGIVGCVALVVAVFLSSQRPPKEK